MLASRLAGADVNGLEKLLFSLGYPQVLARGFASATATANPCESGQVARWRASRYPVFDGHKTAGADHRERRLSTNARPAGGGNANKDRYSDKASSGLLNRGAGGANPAGTCRTYAFIAVRNLIDARRWAIPAPGER
jgi:hypothetical protein